MNWIDIKDLLPEFGKDVLIYNESGIYIGYLECIEKYQNYESAKFLLTKDFYDTRIEATHWMPLPEPPKI